jgi:hypothetical protein
MTGAGLIADTRVCVKRGEEYVPLSFGVQKIHPLAPWMAIGFAGSVELGFGAVEHVRRRLRPLPPAHGYRPGKVAWHAGRRLRFWWTQADPALRELGLQLMLIGAGPSHTGLPPGMNARTHGYVLTDPDFRPEPMPQRRAFSIGSGGDVEEYQAALEEFAVGDDERFHINERTANIMRNVTNFPPSVVPLTFAIRLNAAMERRPEPTVSEHLHLCWVQAGGVVLSTNEMEAMDPGGTSRRMPPIAATLEEFQALLRRYPAPVEGVAVR